jgi:hypothetical protein
MAQRYWERWPRQLAADHDLDTDTEPKAERKLAEVIEQGRKAGQIAKRTDTLKQGSVHRGPVVGETLADLGINQQRLNEARQRQSRSGSGCHDPRRVRPDLVDDDRGRQAL